MHLLMCVIPKQLMLEAMGTEGKDHCVFAAFYCRLPKHLLLLLFRHRIFD